jgi:hypothetical protein
LDGALDILQASDLLIPVGFGLGLLLDCLGFQFLRPLFPGGQLGLANSYTTIMISFNPIDLGMCSFDSLLGPCLCSFQLGQCRLRSPDRSRCIGSLLEQWGNRLRVPHQFLHILDAGTKIRRLIVGRRCRLQERLPS